LWPLFLNPIMFFECKTKSYLLKGRNSITEAGRYLMLAIIPTNRNAMNPEVSS